MPLTIGSKLAETWYTPKDHAEDSNPPRFKLRPLNGATRMKVTSCYNRFTGSIGFDGIQAALMVGVVDWQNIVTPGGKDVKFSVTKLLDLDQDVLTELFNELYASSELDEEEEKNSE